MKMVGSLGDIYTLRARQPKDKSAQPSLGRLLFVDPDIEFYEFMKRSFEGRFNVDYARSLEEAQRMLANTYNALSTELFIPMSADRESGYNYRLTNAPRLVSDARRSGILYTVALSDFPLRLDSGAHKVYKKELVRNDPSALEQYLDGLKRT